MEGRSGSASTSPATCSTTAIFLDEYKRVYEKVPCPKDCIEFELLESIVLNQLDLVQDVVEQLRDYGFSCSLDDFGSGYSSFSVLTSTELKTLKIDRSLFRNYPIPENVFWSATSSRQPRNWT